MTESAMLSVAGLRVQRASGEAIVEDVSLELAGGEILGLVGESGSGKTTTALAMLGYAAPGVQIAAGTITVANTPLARDTRKLRAVRGSLVSYVPQNPGTALNPSLRVAAAIEDVIRAHTDADGARMDAASALATVELPTSREFGRRFPHQLSGGQQQRVCIAASWACEPAVIVLDEPTTGLDVVTQSRILDELDRLRNEQGVSMIYVTHDLAVVAQIADRIAVMYAGRIVEEGPSRAVLRTPKHPYTRGLIASIPDHARPSILEAMRGISVGVGERPRGCAFAPRCPQRVERCDAGMPPLEAAADNHQVRCFEWSRTPSIRAVSPPAGPDFEREGSAAILHVEHLRAVHQTRGASVTAAADVSFIVEQRTCVALVGESGSGKTTIARVIAGLHPIAGGQVRLGDEPLTAPASRRTTDQRRRVQLIFQDPADALNPRHTVAFAIGRPARTLRHLDTAEVNAEVTRLLEAVRLPSGVSECYPAELSGGERQRVAIARALVAQPELLICDEVTSALDVSVQAAVLNLLRELREELQLAMLFITHDLGVVASIADEVLVLEHGLVCERGPTRVILSAPQQPYTQRLLRAAPSLSAAIAEWDSADGRKFAGSGA